MNNEMAYFLGMICGNGSIQRGPNETTISVDIPHKKLETETQKDVKIYVKASMVDFRSILEPLLGASLKFSQNVHNSILSFTKENEEYTIREILDFIGHARSHEDIRVSNEIFSFTKIQKLQFLKGFSDVTGYIRRSNNFFQKYEHRVYLEIPHNWFLVVDICNLLKSVDIPVHTIDWAHPNMRDANLKKYNQGSPNFWKKEHQIKIWANEFQPIGFAVNHKREALEIFARELVEGYVNAGKNPSKLTHRFYWESSRKKNNKPYHPGENDLFIPEPIRGKHFDSWKDIARELGYGKES